MKQTILLGTTDYTTLVFVPDPASTDGSGKTGLVAANLTASYTRVETDNDVTVTDVTSSLNNLANLTAAHNDWGWLEVSNTLAPGLYRFDIADAVFAAGAWSGVVYVMITTSAAAPSPSEFILVAYDQLNATSLGLTNLDAAITSRLAPTVATRTLDVTATGAAGIDWANVEAPTTTLALTGTTIATTQKVDVETIKTNPVVNGGTITFPTTATLASTTNITAGTVTTATNVTTVNGLAAGVITATSIAANAFAAAKFAADFFTAIITAIWTDAATRVLTAATNLTTALATPTNITAGTITTVTNLTNAPTNGDLTAAMKTSVTAAVPTAIANADALLDRADAVEVGLTPRQEMRLTAAASAGKLSGAPAGPIVIRNAVADSKDRITATVDGSGNRTAVVTDVT